MSKNGSHENASQSYFPFYAKLVHIINFFWISPAFSPPDVLEEELENT